MSESHFNAKKIADSDQQNDSVLPKWTRTTAGIIGILATITTMFVGLYSLIQQQHEFQRQIFDDRSKEAQAADDRAKTENEIAKTNREQADIQLQTARLSNLQHKEDLQNERLIEKQREAQQEDVRLTGIISGMFQSNQPSEGSLALLSDFVNKDDARHRTTILGAIAAKLQNPRSVGEVDLAFHLLKQYGPEAVDTVIVANKGARKQFDRLILAHLWVDVREHLPVPNANTKLDALMEIVRRANVDLSLSSTFRGEYESALIGNELDRALGMDRVDNPNEVNSNSKQFEERLIAESSNAAEGLGYLDVSDWRLQATIQSAIMSDSVDVLGELLEARERTQESSSGGHHESVLDLREAYLGGIKWPKQFIKTRVLADGAYVNGNEWLCGKELDAFSRASFIENAVRPWTLVDARETKSSNGWEPPWLDFGMMGLPRCHAN